MNSRNELFDFSKQCIKGRRNLKIKMKRLTDEYIQNNCEEYLKKQNRLNLFELNNELAIKNAIKLGSNFHFNKNNYNSLNRNINNINNSIINESIKFNNDYKHFSKTLNDEFSINELEAIKNDQLYYIPNINIRNNLKINKKVLLYKDNKKPSDVLQINKRIYNKFCKRDENATQKILKNIKKVKKIIKFGINNLKNEEKKRIMTKEKLRKLINNFHEQSKKEVHSLIKETSFKKIFNNRREEHVINDYNHKYNTNICKSMDMSNKIKTDLINKSQNSCDNKIRSYNNSLILFPKIFSQPLKNKPKNLIKNYLLNPSENTIKQQLFSSKLSGNTSFINNSSNSISKSRESFSNKRLERIERMEDKIETIKKEKEICKNYIKKIRANYAKKYLAKLNLKYSLQ